MHTCVNQDIQSRLKWEIRFKHFSPGYVHRYSDGSVDTLYTYCQSSLQIESLGYLIYFIIHYYMLYFILLFLNQCSFSSN